MGGRGSETGRGSAVLLPARALSDHAHRLLLTPACVSGNPPHPHQCPLQVCLPPHHVQLPSLGPVAVKGRKVSREFPTSLAPPVLSPAWISLPPPRPTHTVSFIFYNSAGSLGTGPSPSLPRPKHTRPRPTSVPTHDSGGYQDTRFALLETFM